MMRINAHEERDRALTAAVAAVRRGDLVLVPTEHVYAFATDAFHQGGTSTLRQAKGYGPHVSLPLFVASATMVSGIARTTPVAESLMEAFWPGLLTLVLPSQSSVAWDAAAGGTIAVRMPLHPIALDLVRRTGPLAVTSANPAGADPPSSIEEASRVSVSVAVDVGVLEAAQQVSTMIDLTGDAPRVIRSGSVGVPELAALHPEFDWSA
jgi:L-threonylcarbamoyladenylate synthase